MFNPNFFMSEIAQFLNSSLDVHLFDNRVVLRLELSVTSLKKYVSDVKQTFKWTLCSVAFSQTLTHCISDFLFKLLVRTWKDSILPTQHSNTKNPTKIADWFYKEK